MRDKTDYPTVVDPVARQLLADGPEKAWTAPLKESTRAWFKQAIELVEVECMKQITLRRITLTLLLSPFPPCTSQLPRLSPNGSCQMLRYRRT